MIMRYGCWRSSGHKVSDAAALFCFCLCCVPLYARWTFRYVVVFKNAASSRFCEGLSDGEVTNPANPALASNSCEVVLCVLARPGGACLDLPDGPGEQSRDQPGVEAVAGAGPFVGKDAQVGGRSRFVLYCVGRCSGACVLCVVEAAFFVMEDVQMGVFCVLSEQGLPLGGVARVVCIDHTQQHSWRCWRLRRAVVIVFATDHPQQS